MSIRAEYNRLLTESFQSDLQTHWHKICVRYLTAVVRKTTTDRGLEAEAEADFTKKIKNLRQRAPYDYATAVTETIEELFGKYHSPEDLETELEKLEAAKWKKFIIPEVHTELSKFTSKMDRVFSSQPGWKLTTQVSDVKMLAWVFTECRTTNGTKNQTVDFEFELDFSANDDFFISMIHPRSGPFAKFKTLEGSTLWGVLSELLEWYTGKSYQINAEMEGLNST